MLKVVIDTNLLIDGSTDFYHFANRIIDLVIAGQIEAYANAPSLRENVLLARKKIDDEGYLKKLQYFFDLVYKVESSKRIHLSEDKDDDKFLESSMAARADYLITSDRHLLDLKKLGRTQIVRPDEFWARYEDEGEGWANWLRAFIK